MPLDLAGYVAATAALGTAAFGLVDASKAWRGGGISERGFPQIERVTRRLVPGTGATAGALPLADILATLHANWINGTAAADQKSIAKTLIKLHLAPDNAALLAQQTGVDATRLVSVATKIQTGEALTQPESDVYGRFDLILATLLDEAYQRADQQYRNTAKLAAVGVAVVVAIAGGWALDGSSFGVRDCAIAIVTGLIATPLAPMAKDLSTALASAATALKAWRA